jgi:hypothetical protein
VWDAARKPGVGCPVGAGTTASGSEVPLADGAKAGRLCVHSRSPAVDSWQIGPWSGPADTGAVAELPVHWWWLAVQSAGWVISTTSNSRAGAHHRHAHRGMRARSVLPFTTISR